MFRTGGVSLLGGWAGLVAMTGALLSMGTAPASFAVNEGIANNGFIAYESPASPYISDQHAHTGWPVLVRDDAGSVVRGVGAAWSPDGRFLAYSALGDLYVSDWRGRGQRRLMTTAQIEVSPAWSPDGRKMSFVRDGALWVSDIEGSNQRQLVDGCCADSPTWSPDGTQIAFASTQGGSSQIYRVSLEGRESPTRLTEGPGENFTPDWSPDGVDIAFSTTRTRPNSDLWLMAPDGSAQRPLLERDGHTDSPTWSPDGELIMFDGGFFTTITRDGSTISYTHLSGDDPDWQPLPPCTITGTPGDDVLDGTDSVDVICGLGGDDTIDSKAGDDIVIGGPGSDTIRFVGVGGGVHVNLQEAVATGNGEDMLLEMENATGNGRRRSDRGQCRQQPPGGRTRRRSARGEQRSGPGGRRTG